MSENGKPPDNGTLCLSEVREGTVTRVVDDDVEVVYETDSDVIVQVYDRRQFINAAPQENDRRPFSERSPWGPSQWRRSRRATRPATRPRR